MPCKRRSAKSSGPVSRKSRSRGNKHPHVARVFAREIAAPSSILGVLPRTREIRRDYYCIFATPGSVYDPRSSATAGRHRTGDDLRIDSAGQAAHVPRRTAPIRGRRCNRRLHPSRRARNRGGMNTGRTKPLSPFGRQFQPGPPSGVRITKNHGHRE